MIWHFTIEKRAENFLFRLFLKLVAARMLRATNKQIFYTNFKHIKNIDLDKDSWVAWLLLCNPWMLLETRSCDESRDMEFSKKFTLGIA